MNDSIVTKTMCDVSFKKISEFTLLRCELSYVLQSKRFSRELTFILTSVALQVMYVSIRQTVISANLLGSVVRTCILHFRARIVAVRIAFSLKDHL